MKNLKVIMGNHALSYGAKLSRVEVISAYPITPQTQVVELLSEMVGSGELNARFVNVESEHSALAVCISASIAGARAFTATSAQGLALMHELLHWASSARTPIVMGVINRAMATPWSIWTEQTDSLSQRDTGWMQIYCESNQEVLDSVILSYKVGERVFLPTMIVLEAFVLSHTSEPVEIPDQKIVDDFLPPYKNPLALNTSNPRAIGAVTSPDFYMEFRYKIQKAMEEAIDIIKEEGKKFEEKFGRYWGLVESFFAEDSEIVIVCAGAYSSTVKYAVKKMRENGKNIGVLRIRVFRPFPYDEIRKYLVGKKVIVLDRNISFGAGGIFFQEIKSALFGQKKTKCAGYILGLGGRDITPSTIEEIVSDFLKRKKFEEINFWGLKK
ncbi:MAG: pyruvate ferredoxin oxidoreductase [candidate division WOR-3 bacterium]|uniref:Pyruvate ferredoxin oxidoreductase n=3 Tax=candidate division WOR-3 bacterium TaxID=2052148 RepID=A0A7V3ZSV3_UNCW3